MDASFARNLFRLYTVNSEWAEVEGVKATAEGYIAPIFFLVVNTILLFNMSDFLYVNIKLNNPICT